MTLLLKFIGRDGMSPLGHTEPNVPLSFCRYPPVGQALASPGMFFWALPPSELRLLLNYSVPHATIVYCNTAVFTDDAPYLWLVADSDPSDIHADKPSPHRCDPEIMSDRIRVEFIGARRDAIGYMLDREDRVWPGPVRACGARACKRCATGEPMYLRSIP